MFLLVKVVIVRRFLVEAISHLFLLRKSQEPRLPRPYQSSLLTDWRACAMTLCVFVSTNPQTI